MMQESLPTFQKRNVRDTSRLAYSSLPQKSHMQKMVLWYIRNFPDRTDRELASHMHFSDPNHVRPRRKELLDMGCIEESGKRRCRISGRQAYTWRER